jgi:hypothetical protein
VLGFSTPSFPVQVFDLGHDRIDGLVGLNFLSELNYEVRSAERRILAVKMSSPRLARTAYSTRTASRSLALARGHRIRPRPELQHRIRDRDAVREIVGIERERLVLLGGVDSEG